MGQIVVNVGSFDLTSHNGNTAYSTTRYFDIPSNDGITSCVATFVTHVNTGSFQGKSFSLNGTQAHPNTPWPTSGIALNTALLSTGQNTFRAAVKSQADLSARWSIGDIYLTIRYTDPAGSGGGSPTGGVSVNKTWIDAGGGNVTVTSPAQGNRWQWGEWSFGGLSGTWSHPWNTGGSYAISVPIEWCNQIPNDASGILYIKVKQSDTPAEPYNFVSEQNFQVKVNVPASVVPTIGTFTATLNKNGVDASITGYVQNYSKVDLEVLGASGALGSTISAYEIIGGGWSGDEALETFGPFSQSGDITFTAKVTDTRGRTVTGSVTINVLPYTPVSAVSISAFRSDSSGDPDDEGTYAALKGKRVYSLLGGENSATIRGRVFEKGTTPSSWSSMTDDTALMIGSLSIEKGYTAHIAIEDKVTSVVYVVEIPTSIVGIHIVPGATGGGFGMYGVSGRWDFSAPIFSPEGACPGIGDILITLNSDSPATRFPGTTWAAIENMFLVGAGDIYDAGDTGGEATHTLTELEIPSHYHPLKYGGGVSPGSAPDVGAGSSAASETTGNAGGGEAHNNLPPYLAVYIWERTA